MANPRCWGFRIATDWIQYLAAELEEGRLRQGWGWHEGQDLLNLTFDGGARRNQRMLEVRQGDLLLVPRLPKWDQVSIVEATEDWRSGYRFQIDPEVRDLGHIFPARRVKSFVRGNEHVGNIRATLRNPSRFWNVDHLYSAIRRLRDTTADLGSSKTSLEIAQEIATGVFNKVLVAGGFKKEIFNRLNESLEGKDWERVLEAVMTMRYPTAEVKVVQGRSEVHHGTDILVKLPDITGEPTYAIAIQVKDHAGQVTAAAADQIGKADYWESEDCKVIHKVVVFTQATRTDNEHLKELTEKDVQIVFGEELQEILGEWAQQHAAASLL